ncbi:hypothetical protein MUS1_10930 [Marinomonas ushuaiensis DSM 15871]|uniref:DUF945 domain-containing protein n=1 Tax=Marinomonas ushuaiensis DSM 15871 TaxID=1122207 RepID=X7E6F3_9GAMM|nr:DUF945 family protein [Marinomonas ushuaiensis]ETX11400.1 hypothetical protein MUS1_10930 [Marinomonas ushuaiensis DSM 15871]
MKKIFAVIAFALVAVCLVTPKFIAPKFQEQVITLVDKINKTSGYTAIIESTESSWFGSTYVISFGLDLGMYEPAYENQKLDLQLVLDAKYGPLLLANQGIVGLYEAKLKIAADEQRQILAWDEAEPLYQLSAVGGFGGDIKIEDTIPAFSKLDNGLTFSGYNGEGKISRDAVAYEGLLALVNLDDPYQPVKAENITLSMQMEAGLESILKGGFYNSTTSFSIDSFTVGTDIKASNLSMLVKMILDEETQLGSLEVGYFAKELVYNEYQVSDFILKSELAKLSNQFFIDYTRFNDSLVDQNLASDEFLIEQLSFLQDSFAELLSHQPEFNITDFSATFPEGRFNASLTSKLADIETPTFDEMLIPEFWLFNTLASINIEADDALISNFVERFLATKMRTTINSPDVKQQARIIINSFEQQDFIFHEDSQYRSEITLKDGQANINGRPFPLM